MGEGQAAWGRGRSNVMRAAVVSPAFHSVQFARGRPASLGGRIDFFPASVFISGAEILISVAEATQSMARPRPLLGLQLLAQTISNRQNFIRFHAQFLGAMKQKHRALFFHRHFCVCTASSPHSPAMQCGPESSAIKAAVTGACGAKCKCDCF